MKLKTYRANTIADALTQVKKDLGRDAVILHTRTVRTGGIFGLWSKSLVEITASDQVNVAAKPAAPARAERTEPRAVRAAAIDAYRKVDAGDRVVAARVPPEPTASETTPIQPGVGPAESRALASDGAVVMNVSPRRSAAGTSSDSGFKVNGQAGSLHKELAEIKLLVNQVLQAAPADRAAGGTMPEALFQSYLRLLESQVSRDMADRIIAEVRDELNPGEMQDPAIVRTSVLRHLAGLLPVAEHGARPGPTRDGRPLTIAMIGPTGVGKTTTTAKLAAAYKLRHGKSVALITSDTYRIAAVDQLRTYASIIGLPLKVVMTPAEMAAAVESLGGHDVIMVDTAGRSQNNADRLVELAEFLDAARPHETHLVLSTASSEEVMIRTARAFMPARPNRVLFTKLDEAVNFGVLVNVMRRLGLDLGGDAAAAMPLSYITTGQEVPDHIEPGVPDRLARMILDNRLSSGGAADAAANVQPTTAIGGRS